MPESSTALQTLFDSYFNDFIDTRYPIDDEKYPLNKAIHYALTGPGKHVRPLLSLLSAEASHGDVRSALPIATAIEMVHTYSLIHDDLPCMDNDDLRRGRPTLHKVFNESTALLTGDALLTDSFSTICSAELPDENKCKMIEILGDAAGSKGMVIGQHLDLIWTGRSDQTRDVVDRIHRGKTAALLGAAAALGAAAGPASHQTIILLRDFGEAIGLAFQIKDDLLDEQGGLGKTAGKDRATQKSSYLTVMSRDQAEQAAKEATEKATEILNNLEGPTDSLKAFAYNLLGRQL